MLTLLGWSCPTLTFSLASHSTFYKYSCLYEKKHIALLCRGGRVPRTWGALNFGLPFLLSCIEKHSKQTGFLLISCKQSWEGKLLIAPTGLQKAHTQLSRTVLKIQLNSNPYTSQAWSSPNITTCSAARFSPGCLYRLVTGFSLVMKQLPNFRHECNVLTHCQVRHTQDNNVQKVQESGFILKLTFISHFLNAIAVSFCFFNSSFFLSYRLGDQAISNPGHWTYREIVALFRWLKSLSHTLL